MKKSTKGAVAAAAAGALLLGGAGSLAYWSDAQNVGTASITSGNLTLSAPDCVTATGSHSWQLDTGDAYTDGTTKLVPGDSISKVCDMTLTLTGDHIGANLAIDTADFAASTPLASQLTPTATFTVGGLAYTPITTPGTHTVRATITVNFDGANATNASRAGSAALNAINVKATQTHN